MKFFGQFSENAMNQMRRTIRLPIGSFVIPRNELPQIKNVPSFLKWLYNSNIAYKRGEVRVDKLKPIQTDLSHNKILGMMQSDDPNIYAPFIISKDGYILDGHHRWSAIFNKYPYFNCQVWRVDLPMKELLAKSREFPGATFESV